MSARYLIETTPMQPAEPLWQRVPTRTEHGELAADFMMLFRQLRQAGRSRQQQILDDLQGVLHYYGKLILFAELNLRLNTLWVSHRPRPGLGLEIAAAIHCKIPQAVLITQNYR